MKASNRTKQCRNRYIIFSILHFLCLFGPFLYYIPFGFVIGTPVEKVSLSLVIILSLCIGAFSIFLDAKNNSGLSKSIMWLMIIGVMTCLARIETFICIMAVVSILDELVIVKIRAKYKSATIANKEIDRRT